MDLAPAHLFRHVRTTVAAVATSVAAAAVTLASNAGIAQPIVSHLFGHSAGTIVAAAPIVSALAALVAGLGKSPLASTSKGPFNMSALVKLLDGLVMSAEANKPAVLAFLAAEGLKVEDMVVAAIAAKNPLLGSLAKMLGPQLMAFLGAEEEVAFMAVDALAHAEAAKL